MSAVLDAPIDNQKQLVVEALKTIKLGGKLIVGYYMPISFNNTELLRVAKEHGYGLEEIPCRAFYGDANRGGGIFKLSGKPA